MPLDVVARADAEARAAVARQGRGATPPRARMPMPAGVV